MKYLIKIKIISILVTFLYIIIGANALIPIDCVGNVTKLSARCCPRNPENYQVCGGPKRGFCSEIVAPVQYVPAVFQIDDRVSWPNRFFSHACQCVGNFYGTSCEQCWFGWTGHDCKTRKITVRKDLRDFTEKERRIFIDVLDKSQTWPSGYAVLDESNNLHSDPLTNPRFESASIQYYINYQHRYGSRTTLYKNDIDCNSYGILDFIHDGPVFPTWHRYFTLIWERMLGNIAKAVYGTDNFSAPYWDYIGMKECDICTNKYLGAPGKEDNFGLRIDEHSILHNWTEYCYEPNDKLKCYGCQHAGVVGKLTRRWRNFDFPDQSDVQFIINHPKYFSYGERDSLVCDSFSMALEGFCGSEKSGGPFLWMHNKVHNMIDGSMCCVGTAANDPFFLIHHTMIDKIFTIWYDIHKPDPSEFPQQATRPGHCKDCFMTGFIPLARNIDMFTDTRALGYVYDNHRFGVTAQNGEPMISF